MTTASDIFRVALAYQNLERSEIDLAGVHVEQWQTPYDPAQFDLTLTVEDRPHREADDDVTALFTYATDLFDAATIDVMAGVFSAVLAAVVADPGRRVGSIDIDLAPAPAPAPAAARPTASGTPTSAPTRRAASAVATAVESDPTAPAYAKGETEVSFAALDARSNRFARALLADGAGPGVVVAASTDDPVDLVAVAWAATKIGAAIAPDAGDAAVVLPEDVAASFGPGPLGSADDVRTPGPTDPFVVSPSGTISYDVLDRALADNVLGATYESRLAIDGRPGSVLSVLATVAAAAAGATVVDLDRSTELTDAVADEWVTHLVATTERIALLDIGELEDLTTVIVDDGDTDTEALPEPGPDVTVIGRRHLL